MYRYIVETLPYALYPIEALAFTPELAMFRSDYYPQPRAGRDISVENVLPRTSTKCICNNCQYFKRLVTAISGKWMTSRSVILFFMKKNLINFQIYGLVRLLLNDCVTQGNLCGCEQRAWQHDILTNALDCQWVVESDPTIHWISIEFRAVSCSGNAREHDRAHGICIWFL